MNLASTAPVPSTTAPEYVRLSWVSGGFGVSKRHELNVDFRATPEAPDNHVTMTTLANVKVPVWFGADVFQGAENDTQRAALRDAITGSGLLGTKPSDTLQDPERGELQVVFGTNEAGFQPTFVGSLKDLTPELQRVWDAAQDFLDDAKVAKHVGPGDLGED
jgi:hypothetical protein